MLGERADTRNFNPRSPHGERPALERIGAGRSTYFNPRSPHGERLLEQARESKTTTFQSTLPARGATKRLSINSSRRRISIHAPRTGSDPKFFASARRAPDFNPRSPHGERLLTAQLPEEGHKNFNPRSPHGERHGRISNPANRPVISIHAPRTGSDQEGWRNLWNRRPYFNPRSPHGERRSIAAKDFVDAISIHAPRTGSDLRRPAWRMCQSYFNPRSPHGERPTMRRLSRGAQNFNPRSPHGERPRYEAMTAEQREISIHAPRTGSDSRGSLHGNS